MQENNADVTCSLLLDQLYQLRKIKIFFIVITAYVVSMSLFLLFTGPLLHPKGTRIAAIASTLLGHQNGSDSPGHQNGSLTPGHQNGSLSSGYQNGSYSSPAQSMSSPSPHSIAVLFTTFSDNPKKKTLFENAIRNWATFLPAIQPLLFSTNPESPLNTLAARHGWKVVQGTKLNFFKMPYLKHMYLTAYDIEKNASFYAFCNGDILFDDGLIRTLVKLHTELAHLNTTLVSGKRRDYSPEVACNRSEVRVWSQQDVQKLGRSSKLDPAHAEDYFFVTRDYPWQSIKNVVIGREAYDNYLVARSRQLNLTTVDITNTITALHQCGYLQDRKVKRKLSKNDLAFNNIVTWPFSKFDSGRTHCMQYETAFSKQTGVAIIKRKSVKAVPPWELPKHCRR